MFNHLRVARHTGNLENIRRFYIDILGFQELFEFHGHESYDGLMIGLKGLNWHLEFTMSDELPDHHADEDDALIFYISNTKTYNDIRLQLDENGFKPVVPKNPYWQDHGLMVIDPDGYPVIITNTEWTYSNF